MAQAQKSVGVNSVERFVGFVGGLAKLKPEALDKLNTDEMIDNYVESIGVSTIVSSNDQVAAIRQQRAEQQQQMQQMQMAQEAVAGAQALVIHQWTITAP